MFPAMPNADPHILTVELLPADGSRYLAPVHIETVYCRTRAHALSAADRRMAELAGRRNPSHSFQAGVFTVSDPAGPRWQCYRLSVTPAQLDTGREHGPQLPDAYAFAVGPAGASTTDPRATWLFTASRLLNHGTAWEHAACQYFAAVQRVPADSVRVLARWPR